MRLTKKLFDYLDGFEFVDDCETLGAILEYYKIDTPFYSELARASELVEYYKEYKRMQNEGLQVNWGILRTF